MTTEEANKKKDHKGPLDDGSPITVGGGGGIEDETVTDVNLSCVFDESTYRDPEPGNEFKKFFKHSDSQIKTLKVYSAGAVEDWSTDLPANGECEIEVHATGSRDDVTFTSQEAGDGTMEFGIEMDTRRYKGNGSVHRADQPSHINKIELRGIRTENFSGGDNCQICVDYVAPRESKCFTWTPPSPPDS
jgi:hypothetical protein